MQLTLLTTGREKAAAQKLLEDAFEDLPYCEVRTVSFRPEAMRTRASGFGPRRLWGLFRQLDDADTPRYWNAFGLLPQDATDRLFIAAECNIPFSKTRTVAGFFARDALSGQVLLMHDGRIGGGREGIGRQAFLDWSGDESAQVVEPDRTPRPGLIVAVLGRSDTALQIKAFVHRVATFKAEVSEQAPPAALPGGADPFLAGDEYRGRKSGAPSPFDYVTYHGDVVRALVAERRSQASAEEEVGRTSLINVAVRVRDEVTEVYEIKTSLDRQALYTAIGELIVHGTGRSPIRRTLVVPLGDMPADVACALAAERVTVRRFGRSATNGTVNLLS